MQEVGRAFLAKPTHTNFCISGSIESLLDRRLGASATYIAGLFSDNM
jgi:hypothetical protein